MRVALYILFHLGIILSGISVAAQPQLRLNLKLDKAQYAAGEAVIARITLENLGSSDVVVNSRLLVNRPIGPHELFFNIIGPDRKVVRFKAHIRASFESREFVTLKSKQVLERTYNLSWVHAFDMPGEYTATLFYENKHDPPSELQLAPAWKGRVKSNPVKFMIK